MKTGELKSKLVKCCFISKSLIYIDSKKAISLINQFKKEMCKDQRLLCSEAYNDSTNRWELEVMERIENTDEPK